MTGGLRLLLQEDLIWVHLDSHLFQAWHGCFDGCKPTEREVKVSDGKIPKSMHGICLLPAPGRRTYSDNSTSFAPVAWML